VDLELHLGVVVLKELLEVAVGSLELQPLVVGVVQE
jgi:hypothetical protein